MEDENIVQAIPNAKASAEAEVSVWVCNPPRPQRGSDQTAASLNGVLRRSDSEEILQGSENGCVLILKKVYGVALVGTGGPAPCRWALPDR